MKSVIYIQLINFGGACMTLIESETLTINSCGFGDFVCTQTVKNIRLTRIQTDLMPFVVEDICFNG
jgi:hypothetical protein